MEKKSITKITLAVCLCVRVLVLARVCVVPDRSSSDSSDCHIVRAQNSKSSPSVVPYNVTISTSPEPDLRRSSSTLQDEELTGSYTVSSTTGNDYNVRSSLYSTVVADVVKAKFHYASWFGAGSEHVQSQLRIS